MDISGSTFFISGGGSGLGAATAKEIVNAGGNVVLGDINKAAGQLTAQTLGKAASFVEADITRADQVQSALESGIDTFGRLDGVINCAGIAIAAKTVGKGGPHPLDAFQKVININLVGTFNVIRLAAAIMVENSPGPDGERGIIINTASVAAYDGQVGQAAYAASKG